MKQLRVTVRVQNNLLLARRVALGFTQAEMAQAADVNIHQYGGLESMKLSPQRAGGWTTPARRIADFYDLTPEDLWPDEVLAVNQHCVVREADVRDVAAMLHGDRPGLLDSPIERAASAAEMKLVVRRALTTLTPREERVLRMRFGIGDREHTLEEVGQDFEVTRERIREIEARALNKLRLHRYSTGLRGLEESDGDS